MTPDVLIHFAERVPQIGVYEGLWWRDPGDPDGIAVRLDDGTRVYVVGHCTKHATNTGRRWEYDISLTDYLRMYEWNRDGFPIVAAFHEHVRDTLHWRRLVEVRHRITATRSGASRVFLPRDAFTISSCMAARA